jgi:hypothetical protein
VTLVVEHQDGSGLQRCVGINGSSAIADTVLANSGVEYADIGSTTGYGDELCQVDNEPSTFPSPCLLPGQPWWSMWVSSGGGPWHASSYAVSTLQLNSGDALGLRFDGANSQSRPPPPNIACPQPASPTRAAASHAPGPRNTTAASSSSAHTSTSGASASRPTSTSQAQPAATATGAALALRTTASDQLVSDRDAISWVMLFAFAAGGSLLGLLTVRVVRR